jgi:hypothetical protein
LHGWIPTTQLRSRSDSRTQGCQTPNSIYTTARLISLALSLPFGTVLFAHQPASSCTQRRRRPSRRRRLHPYLPGLKPTHQPPAPPLLHIRFSGGPHGSDRPIGGQGEQQAPRKLNQKRTGHAGERASARWLVPCRRIAMPMVAARAGRKPGRKPGLRGGAGRGGMG